jgi:CHAD domain-containing protein
MARPAILEKPAGIAYWMEEVLSQCGKVEAGFAADPVHDLRTALRRCRSMAEGIRVFDRDSGWKKMRRAGKELFNRLGGLRDAQVMLEWVEKLSPPGDPVGRTLTEFLLSQEQELKKSTTAALQQFDRTQWRNWAGKLPARAARIPLESRAFAHLALERWLDAHHLHLRALRNRTKVSFHDLRIALKRFRYTLENFLPRLHESWSEDLKELQDLLGEVHDLDVLWQASNRMKAFPGLAERAAWQSRIEQERGQRLAAYRAKMTGKASLWRIWRAALPTREECRRLALERLRIWASFLDPKASHSEHVARIALELYDGLPSDGILPGSKRESYRSILHAAALAHEVGRSRTSRGHHKAGGRLIRNLQPPLGWAASELRTVALVARYHRGALPVGTQQKFRALSPSRRRLVQFLAGILRLACGFDWHHDKKILKITVESFDPVITLRAEGYVESTPLAEHIAAARHLLELTYNQPVFVLAAKEKVQAQAA